MNDFASKSYPVFDLFNNQWGLATAGTLEDYNTCTIAWGTLGTIWGRSICTVFINELRYTNEFMRDNEYFTVSFFPESYREDLELLGRESGRDGNKVAKTKLKVANTSLTPKPLGNSVTFQQAKLTFLCQKLYEGPFQREGLAEMVRGGIYQSWEPHWMFVGEILEVEE